MSEMFYIIYSKTSDMSVSQTYVWFGPFSLRHQSQQQADEMLLGVTDTSNSMDLHFHMVKPANPEVYVCGSRMKPNLSVCKENQHLCVCALDKPRGVCVCLQALTLCYICSR